MKFSELYKKAVVLALAVSVVQTAAPNISVPESYVFAAEEKVEEAVPVIKQTDGKEGNIFYDNEKIVLKALFENIFDKDLNLTADYSVVNYMGVECLSGSIETVSLKSGETKEHTFEFEDLAYDTYKLIINASDEAVGFKESAVIEFSRVVEAKTEADDGMFGVCTHFAQKKGGDPNINMEMIKKAGVKWVRDDFSWGGIEKEKGQYTFDEKDAFVDKILAQDVNVLAILDYGCKYYDEGNAPYSDEGIAAFAKFCGETAKHYIGKIDHFEIWNEYNGGMGNPLRQPPEVYAKMLKAAYEEIKKANPSATVVGCSTSVVDLGWIERVLKAIGPDYMDAVSVHPYGFPASPESAGLEDNMKNTHELLKRYGKDMPVWSTEYGYPTYKEGVSEDVGAAYLARAFMIFNSISSDDKVFWYDFQNDTPASDTSREANFGLIKHETDFYAAKQTLLSFNNIVNKLAGRNFKEITHPNDNIVAYKFSGEEDLLALWSMVKAENCSIQVNAPTITVTDFLGNQKEMQTQNGWITLPISKYPVYLEGKFEQINIEKAHLDSNGEEINVAAGEEFNLILNRSAADADIEYALEEELPEGFSVSEKAEFKKGQTETVIPVKTDAALKNKSYQLKFKIVSDGKSCGECDVNVNVVADRSVTVLPVILDTENWESWAFDIKVKNNSRNVDFGGKVTITEPEQFAGQYADMEFPSISYGEEEVIRVPVPTKPDNKLIPLKLKVEFTDGAVQEISRNISCLAAVKTEKPINIDGVFTDEEWAKAMPYEFADRSKLNGDNGESDISAKGAIMWDKKNLYFGVVVTDDVQFQDQDGSGMWLADGLQVVMDPGRINGAGSMDWHEIGYGLKNLTDVGIWRWLSIPGKPGGAVTNINAVIKRDEEAKTTTYEIAAPWEELLPMDMTLDTGDIFGFSILANESDGTGRRGWINYMGGIADDKKPERFGDVVMIDLNECQQDNDVKESDDTEYIWAHGAVENLFAKKMIAEAVESYPYGASVKAGDFVAMMIKCMGIETEGTAWETAENLGVITSDISVNQDSVLSRQNMMVILEGFIKAAGNEVEEGNIDVLSSFNDAKEISDYAKQSIANLVCSGIIKGDGVSLYPLADTKNAEAAVVYDKILK